MEGCFKICCCFLIGLLSLFLFPFLLVFLISCALRVYKKGSIFLTFGKPTIGGIEFCSITVREHGCDAVSFFCTMYRPAIRLYWSFGKQNLTKCIPKIFISVNFLEIGVVKEHNDIKKISLTKPLKYQFLYKIFVSICRFFFSFVLLRIDHMQVLVCVSESFLTKEPVKHKTIEEKYERIQMLEEECNFLTSFFRKKENLSRVIKKMGRGIVFQMKCRVTLLETITSCHKNPRTSISCEELQSQCYVTAIDRDLKLFKVIRKNLMGQEFLSERDVFSHNKEKKAMPTIFCVMTQWSCLIEKKNLGHCLWSEKLDENDFHISISFLNEKTHSNKNVVINISMIALARLVLYSSYYRKISKTLKDGSTLNAVKKKSKCSFLNTWKHSSIVGDMKYISVIFVDEQLPRFCLYEAEDVILTKNKCSQNNCFEYKNSSACISIVKENTHLSTILSGYMKLEKDPTGKMFFKKLKQIKETSESLACITGITVTMRETLDEKTLNRTFQLYWKINQIMIVYLPYGLIFWLQQVVHVYDLFRFFQKEIKLNNVIEHNVGNCIRYSCGICHETFGSSKCHSGFRLCLCKKCNVTDDFHTYEEDVKMGVHPTLPKVFSNFINIKRIINKEGFDSQLFFKNFCKGFRLNIDNIWGVLPYSEFTLENMTTPNASSKELLVFQATQLIFEASPLTKSPFLYLKTSTVYACDGIPSSTSYIQIPKKFYLWLNRCSNVSKQLQQKEPVVCFQLTAVMIVYGPILWSDIYHLRRPVFYMDIQHVWIDNVLKLIHGVWMVLEMITKDTFFFKKELFLTKEFFPVSKSLYSCDIMLKTGTVTLLPSKKTKMLCETINIYRDSNSKTTSISFDHAKISTLCNFSELSYIKIDKLSFWLGCCVLSRQESLKDLQNFIHLQENVVNGFPWTVYHKKIYVKNLKMFVDIHHPYPMLKEEFFSNPIKTIREGLHAKPILEHYVCEKPKAWLYDTYNVLPETESSFNRSSFAIQNGLICFLYSDPKFHLNKQKVLMGSKNCIDYESSRQTIDRNTVGCNFPNDSFWGCFGTPLLMMSVRSCFLRMQNPLIRVDALSKKINSDFYAPLLASHTLKGLACSGFNVSISKTIDSLTSPTKMCCCFFSCSTLGLLDHKNLITNKRLVVHNLYIEQSDFLHIEISGPLFSIVKYIVQQVFPLIRRWSKPSVNVKRCIDSNVSEKMFRTNLSFHINAFGILWKTGNTIFWQSNGKKKKSSSTELLSLRIPYFFILSRYNLNENKTVSCNIEIDMKEGFFIYVPLESQQTIIDPETCLINIQKNILHLSFSQEMDDTCCVMHQTWNFKSIIHGPSGLASSSCKEKNEFLCQQPLVFKIKSIKEHWKLLYKWTWYKRFVYKESIVIPQRQCSFAGSLINIHPSTLFHLIYYLTTNDTTKDYWSHEKSFNFRPNNSDVETDAPLKIQKEFNVQSIVHHFKIRLGMFRMSVFNVRLAHHSNFFSDKSEKQRPRLSQFIFENNIETSCVFKSCFVASEYERQAHGRILKRRYGSFLHLPHVPYVFLLKRCLKKASEFCDFASRPGACDKLAPLIRISILHLGLQKKEVQIHIEKCQLSLNVLTIPSLLGNLRRWGIFLMDLKRLQKNGFFFNGKKQQHYNKIKNCTFLEDRCKDKKTTLAQSMFNIVEEFRINLTYVDFQVNVHFISEAVVMDVKKQMSWYFKSAPKTYCGEEKNVIDVEDNDRVGIQNHSSYLLESLNLANEQKMKKSKPEFLESWNEIENNTHEGSKIFLCCFSNMVDEMSLNEVYPIRDPSLIEYHNVFFLLQSTTGWLLASENESFSCTEEEMEHDVITSIVNKQHLEHDWRKHLTERHKTFHISSGSYLETDLWTNFLQKNKSRILSASDLGHQCLICVERLHVTIQLKTGEEEGVLFYTISMETTPCSGFVGPLEMMGLGWKKNTNGLKKKKTLLTGFDRLDEIVLMKEFKVLSSGHFSLFPWIQIPSVININVTCPVLILICTSEKLQQLIHLFNSVVINSDLFLQRGVKKTTHHNQDPNETLFQLSMDGKQTKKINTSFQLPKYMSVLTQRRLRRSFRTYISEKEANEDKDQFVTNDCFPTQTSDVDIHHNRLKTNKKEIMTDDTSTTITLQCLIDQISFSFLHQDKVFSRCSCTRLRVKICHSLCLYRVTRFYVEVNDILFKCLNSMSKIYEKEKELMIHVLEPMKKDLDQPAIVISAKSRSIFIPTVKTLCFVKIYDEFMVKLEPLQVHLSPTIIENFYSFVFSSQPSTRKIIDIVNPRFPIPEAATQKRSEVSKKKIETYKNRLPSTYQKFFFIHPLVVSVTFTGGHLSFENVLLNYKPFIRRNKMGTLGKMVQMYLWSLGRQTTGAVISCHFKNFVERYQSKRLTHE